MIGVGGGHQMKGSGRMDEYIDKQAALDMVRGLEERYVNNLPPMVDKVDVCNALDTLPSADVQPVRHGHWIEHVYDLFPTEGTVECSECHEHESIFLVNDKYCPNCGARMDSKDLSGKSGR